MAKKTTIRCPHCDTEYLPAEIYFPDSFLGKPFNIIKDGAGNILGFSGNDMETSEVFTCDKCNKRFTVDASVTFRTTIATDIFDEDDFEIVSK